MTYQKKDLIAAALTGGIVSLIVTMLAFSSIIKPETLGANLLGAQKTQAVDINDPSMPTQEKMVINTAAKANPAVVSVIIKKDVPVYEEVKNDQNAVDPNDPFSQFFNGGGVTYKQNGTKKEEIGGGSGFVISPDGYIVTNKHVVSTDGADYSVFTNDGTEYKATIKATDPLNDIAILKIDANNLPYLTFGDSDKLVVGQSVIAIGNPLLEFTNSVSVGVVSGLSRSIVAGGGMGGQPEQIDDVIQTDAAINPGNSGGPLLDLNGNVIGVNVAVATANNIGFALPSNVIRQVVDSVKQNGRVIRPYLGIRYMPINKKVQESNNLPVDHGAYVLQSETGQAAVMPDSPAQKAGIQEKDIILEIDGQKIDGVSISKLIAQHKIGDTINLLVLRGAQQMNIRVTLEEMKDSTATQ